MPRTNSLRPRLPQLRPVPALKTTVAILVVAFLYTSTCLATYTARNLNGNVDKHILAGEMFGVPYEVKERGYTPLYYGDGVSGWDGQFYYYMSNDVLGRGDAPEHVDADAYRYQRIGLSLYAAAVARATGSSFVTPRIFLGSYLLLVLAATVAGARLLRRVGRSQWWILLWALGVGTQVTLFNALPDAAADAFLLLALWLAFRRRYVWAIVPFCLSGLSREVYVLFPSAIFAAHAMHDFVVARRASGRTWGALRSSLRGLGTRWTLVVPPLVVVGWQAYVVNHFGNTPREQAHGILGGPGASWWDYVNRAFGGRHPIAIGTDAKLEGWSLVLYAIVLVAAIAVALRVVASRRHIDATHRGLALATIALVALYACFGPTVMMHYTGYVKAAGVFVLLLPILLAGACTRRRSVLPITVVLTAFVVLTSIYNLNQRILSYQRNYAEIQQATLPLTKDDIECFTSHRAVVNIHNIEFRPAGGLQRLLGQRDLAIVELDVTNTSAEPFRSTRGIGGVFMAGRWVDARGVAIGDTVRTPFEQPLLPGRKRTTRVVADIPTDQQGPLSLVVTPIQEGCRWYDDTVQKQKNVVTVNDVT